MEERLTQIGNSMDKQIQQIENCMEVDRQAASAAFLKVDADMRQQCEALEEKMEANAAATTQQADTDRQLAAARSSGLEEQLASSIADAEIMLRAAEERQQKLLTETQEELESRDLQLQADIDEKVTMLVHQVKAAVQSSEEQLQRLGADIRGEMQASFEADQQEDMMKEQQQSKLIEDIRLSSEERFRELVSMLSEAHKEASVIRKEAQDAMAMIQVVKSELGLELQTALSAVNAEHDSSMTHILAEFQRTSQEWLQHYGTLTHELSEYKQDACLQLEELEVRTEKKWNGIRQAMHVLGTALNLSEPLLHSLNPRMATLQSASPRSQH